ncbi:MAG: ATP-dependent helicase [Casimicrobiaceae bacterium]
MTFALQPLNDAQKSASHFGGTGGFSPPLLVIAGAGTGKTSTLAHRVAWLVQQGADLQRILLLTFTRRAAADLERRATQILRAALGSRVPERDARLPWAGTFHSIGARLLREYAERIGIAQRFTLHDRSDSEDLMKLVRHTRPAADPSHSRFPGAATCVAIYSRTVNAQSSLRDALAWGFPWCAHWEDELRLLFGEYVVAKQAHHVLDLDDLLLYWSAMMGEPALATEIGSRFDFVLVDEYQDTNRLQGTIVRLLKPDGNGVTVVGDDAQAIYGFRAATVRNILDFPRQYATPATVITLERNYRSTQPILAASNAMIALSRERYTKDLVSQRSEGERPVLVTIADEAAEARYVAQQVLARREDGVALASQAVLFRTASHSAYLELELARRDIPFVKFGGLRFLDTAHIKDALCVLRWIENPRGRLAGFRALRLLPGVGPATATRMLDALAESPEPACVLREFAVPAKAAAQWAALLALVETLRAANSTWPAEFESLVDWYRPQLERLYDDAASRVADIAQLQRIACTYASRERFLTELTLDPPAATSNEAGAPHLDEEFLTLSTIHSAKGQEWKAVYVLKCVDGCIPSDMATGRPEDIEEERRVLYVAMTRAKDHLALMLPQRFYTRQQSDAGERHVYASRSRFLTHDVCRHLDHETWPRAAAPATLQPAASLTRIDLAAQFRASWARVLKL